MSGFFYVNVWVVNGAHRSYPCVRYNVPISAPMMRISASPLEKTDAQIQFLSGGYVRWVQLINATLYP
jgi:hypothetical protein